MPTPCLAIETQRPLQLQDPAHPFSAGSGLAILGDRAWAVADDDLHLAEFSLCDEQAPARALRLLPGELPEGKPERKRAKPDFESLVLLPSLPGAPQGALWALPSGSTPARQRSVLLPFHTSGELAPQAALTVDVTPWYALLQQALGEDLNLEGAFVHGGRFCLLQRRTGRHGANACLVFDAQAVFGWLRGEGGPAAPAAVLRYDLGLHDGVALGFTDGTALDDGRWLFSACAEATDDSYNDGAVAGSFVGVADMAGQVHRLTPVGGGWKVEGVALQPAVGAAPPCLWMVTDADDRRHPSLLLKARWP